MEIIMFKKHEENLKKAVFIGKYRSFFNQI